MEGHHSTGGPLLSEARRIRMVIASSACVQRGTSRSETMNFHHIITRSRFNDNVGNFEGRKPTRLTHGTLQGLHPWHFSVLGDPIKIPVPLPPARLMKAPESTRSAI
jgi:hypothetical protein